MRIEHTRQVEIEVSRLLEQAKAKHGSLVNRERGNLELARGVGETLLALKSKCEHGDFTKLVECRAHIPATTARLYMRITRHWDKLVAYEEETGDTLSIRTARTYLKDLLDHKADPRQGEGQNGNVTVLPEPDADCLKGTASDPALKQREYKPVAKPRAQTTQPKSKSERWYETTRAIRDRVYEELPHAQVREHFTDLLDRYDRKLSSLEGRLSALEAQLSQTQTDT